MEVYRFHCPHCEGPLRIQGREHLGRVIDCPECGGKLRISKTGDDLNVSSAEPHRPAVAARKPPTALLSRWDVWTAIAACSIVLVLARAFLVPPSPEKSASEPVANQAVASGTELPKPNSAPDAPVATPPAPIAAKNLKPPEPATSKSPAKTEVVANAHKQEQAPRDVVKQPIDPVIAPTPIARNNPPGAPPKPTVDISKALSQPIRRFQQAEPASLAALLLMFEEMIGAPIRADETEIADYKDLLQTPITIDLADANIGAILKAVLAKATLMYEVERDGLRLHRLRSARIESVPPLNQP